MKKLILIACVGSFSFMSCAQKGNSKVPENVKAIFAKKYPKAEEVKWGKEDDLFEVSFDENELDISVTYDAQGNEKEVEREIAMDDLPQAVKDYVNTNLKDKKIKETAKITDDKGMVKFEVEIGKKDYIFDEKGNLIK